MMTMISQSPLEKNGSTVWELHCLRTALCESIPYQAKSEQNVRQDLIPRVRHGEAALYTPGCAVDMIVLWAINKGMLSSDRIPLSCFRLFY